MNPKQKILLKSAANRLTSFSTQILSNSEAKHGMLAEAAAIQEVLTLRPDEEVDNLKKALSAAEYRVAELEDELHEQ